MMLILIKLMMMSQRREDYDLSSGRTWQTHWQCWCWSLLRWWWWWWWWWAESAVLSTLWQQPRVWTGLSSARAADVELSSLSSLHQSLSTDQPQMTWQRQQQRNWHLCETMILAINWENKTFTEFYSMFMRWALIYLCRHDNILNPWKSPTFQLFQFITQSLEKYFSPNLSKIISLSEIICLSVAFMIAR